MLNILTIIIWILASIAVSAFAGILGKRYGVAYPIAVVASLVVAANILATKLVAIGPFTVPGGVIVFSMTFLITDIIAEKWGKRTAKKAMWASFYSQIVFIISLLIILNWTSPAFAAEQSSLFAKVLSLAPRIVIASLVTYLISQSHDIWAFHFWKKKTDGKHLWLRNNASTVISQLIDSSLFTTIAFYGVFPIIPVILGTWVVKIMIALLDTPFIYLVSWLMDKIQPLRKPLRGRN